MRNLVPVLSIEGHEEETDDRRGKGVHLILQNAASELQKAGIFYSISVTVTRMNLPIVLDKHFIQGTIAKGCKLFFFLEYTAIREGTYSWVLTEE